MKKKISGTIIFIVFLAGCAQNVQKTVIREVNTISKTASVEERKKDYEEYRLKIGKVSLFLYDLKGIYQGNERKNFGVQDFKKDLLVPTEDAVKYAFDNSSVEAKLKYSNYISKKNIGDYLLLGVEAVAITAQVMSYADKNNSTKYSNVGLITGIAAIIGFLTQDWIMTQDLKDAVKEYNNNIGKQLSLNETEERAGSNLK